jgi:hypothetical protein
VRQTLGGSRHGGPMQIYKYQIYRTLKCVGTTECLSRLTVQYTRCGQWGAWVVPRLVHSKTDLLISLSGRGHGPPGGGRVPEHCHCPISILSKRTAARRDPSSRVNRYGRDRSTFHDRFVAWCAQEAADHAARTPAWPPGRQHGQGPS